MDSDNGAPDAPETEKKESSKVRPLDVLTARVEGVEQTANQAAQAAIGAALLAAGVLFVVLVMAAKLRPQSG